jgi:hypothetical protein
MIIRDRSFPHPVVAPFRDDVMPNTFDVTVAMQHDADNYFIDTCFEYNNDTLSHLIAEQRAIHVVHIECRRNFFRRCELSSSQRSRITIAANQILGRIEVCAFIQATCHLTAYRIEGAHADYANATFTVAPGDILAVGFTQRLEAYTDYDQLRHLSSILTIIRSEDEDEGEMKLDTSGERIQVTLSRNDYDRYAELKADPTLGPLLANQVVVPALLHAIYAIRETPEDEDEVEMSKRWFRSIKRKLADLNIDLKKDTDDPIQVVQRLLKLPLRRSLEGLIRMNPMESRQ